MATLVTRYVDTASTAGGDGTVDTTTGSTRAFASLEEFRSWLNTNHPSLVANDVQVDCYFRASTGVQDTAPVAVNGVNFNQTMDSTRYLRLIAQSGQAATPLWSASKYRLVQANGFYSAMTISSLWVHVIGMQMDNTGAKSGESKCLSVPSVNSQRLFITNCYGRCTGTGTATGNGNVMNVTNVSTAQIYVRNSIFTGGARGFQRTYPSSGAITQLDNNLFYGNLHGTNITRDTGGTIRMRNNISYNNATSDYVFSGSGGTLTTSKNLSEDATSPDAAYISKTLTFLNAAGYDFHLVVGDTNAIGDGDDLSADASNPFSTDMEGDARGSVWDLGPDQYASAGPTYSELTAVVIGAVSAGGTGSLPLINGGLIR